MPEQVALGNRSKSQVRGPKSSSRRRTKDPSPETEALGNRSGTKDSSPETVALGNRSESQVRGRMTHRLKQWPRGIVLKVKYEEEDE